MGLYALGHFEDTHGPVPDDGLALGELLLEELERLRADVKAHPSLGHALLHRNHLGVSLTSQMA